MNVRLNCATVSEYQRMVSSCIHVCVRTHKNVESFPRIERVVFRCFCTGIWRLTKKSDSTVSHDVGKARQVGLGYMRLPGGKNQIESSCEQQ